MKLASAIWIGLCGTRFLKVKFYRVSRRNVRTTHVSILKTNTYFEESSLKLKKKPHLFRKEAYFQQPENLFSVALDTTAKF